MMMPRRSNHLLIRIVARMARLSPTRHRDLVQGMLAELDSIVDPAERRRFALGAMTAIARLALGGHIQSAVRASSAFAGVRESDDRADYGVITVPRVTTMQLLRRHVAPFLLSIVTLTFVLIVNNPVRRLPTLRARGLDAGAIAEVLLLSVPWILALTVPMAVFVAVSWVFMCLGSEGVLAAASRERHGVRRLVAPVLCAATVISAVTLVSNTQLVPRTNARLIAVQYGARTQQNSRAMTIGELQAAVRTARAATAADPARAAAYEVEIQKKFALAAACLVLALAGAATAIRFPHGGVALMFGATAIVFTGYHASLVTGESLADRQLMSPVVAMWMANAFLLAVGLLLVSWSNGSRSVGDPETLGIDG
jgi:lipopolysaccharide export LptBFGC system permease protein LptF